MNYNYRYDVHWTVNRPQFTPVTALSSRLQAAVLKLSQSLKAMASIEKCAICLEELDRNALDADTALISSDCMHTFHRICLVTWIEWKRECPLCRADVTVLPEVVTTAEKMVDEATIEHLRAQIRAHCERIEALTAVTAPLQAAIRTAEDNRSRGIAVTRAEMEHMEQLGAELRALLAAAD